MKYFICFRHEKCQLHNSSTCGCKINLTKENIEQQSKRYIALYKTCSSTFFQPLNDLTIQNTNG